MTLPPSPLTLFANGASRHFHASTWTIFTAFETDGVLQLQGATVYEGSTAIVPIVIQTDRR